MHLRLNRNSAGGHTNAHPGLKWIGLAGFMFFFVKGLLWLTFGGVVVANVL